MSVDEEVKNRKRKEMDSHRLPESESKKRKIIDASYNLCLVKTNGFRCLDTAVDERNSYCGKHKNILVTDSERVDSKSTAENFSRILVHEIHPELKSPLIVDSDVYKVNYMGYETQIPIKGRPDEYVIRRTNKPQYNGHEKTYEHIVIFNGDEWISYGPFDMRVAMKGVKTTIKATLMKEMSDDKHSVSRKSNDDSKKRRG